MTSVTRRTLLFLAGLLVGNRAGAAESTWVRLRRVVTTQGKDGRSVVLADGEPGNVLYLNGTRITRLWETSGLPAELPLRGDAGATAGNAYRADFSGTAFYVTEIPGGVHAPTIPMHRNDTLDYMAILSGRLILKLPGRDIELRQGDTLVQGGNDHSFANPYAEPCLLLFVVVTARSS